MFYYSFYEYLRHNIDNNLYVFFLDAGEHNGGSRKGGFNRWKWTAIPGLMTCYKKMYGTAQLRLFKIVFLALMIPIALIDWQYPVRTRLEYITKVIKS